MFCGPNFIRIYLMVFTLIIFFYYCELKDATIPKQDLENQMKDMNNFNRLKRRNYYVYPKRHGRSLKQKFDHQLLKNSIQILKDDTKTQLLKLRNSYLENFSGYGRKAKQEKNSRATRQNSAHKIWRRRSWDDSNDSNDDDDDSDRYQYKQKGANDDLLEEIVEDLDEIRESNAGPPPKGKTCALNGTWVSDLAGVSFNICIPQPPPPPPCNDSCDGERKKYSTSSKSTDKSCDIGDVNINAIEIQRNDDDIYQTPLLNCSWSIAARIPFTRSTMLIITAEYEPSRSVAVFVGQCRYCDRTELVVGQWMVQKYAHDCRRIQLTQDVYGDVFKRPKTCDD